MESITGIGSRYDVDDKQLSAQYKGHFNDYRRWGQLSHAGDWLLFDEDLGESLSIDETCLGSGEAYTFLVSEAGKGGRGALIAVVRGTKAEDVTRVLEKINLSKRKIVKEITPGLSSSMMIIVRTVFPKTFIASDRFYVQKLCYDVLDDMCIVYR